MKLRLAEVSAEERLVVVAGHKTDFLAVCFVGHLEPKPARDLTNFRFGHRSQRRKGVEKLVLVEAEEKIRLVFSVVASLPEHRAIVVVFNDRVVAGGDEVRPERSRLAT